MCTSLGQLSHSSSVEREWNDTQTIQPMYFGFCLGADFVFGCLPFLLLYAVGEARSEGAETIDCKMPSEA